MQDVILQTRESIKEALDLGMMEGAGWRLRYQGAWTKAGWLAWLTYDCGTVRLEWPLESGVLGEEGPWISIRTKYLYIFRRWHTLGLVGRDPIAGEAGPWWDTLRLCAQQLNQNLETVRTATPELLEDEVIYPSPEPDRYQTRHDIQWLRDHY
jgi:hypothetical protein